MLPGIDAAGLRRAEVADQLVPIEIEIDPTLCTAPLRTAEQATVEGARLGKIVHGDGKMKGRNVLVHQDSPESIGSINGVRLD